MPGGGYNCRSRPRAAGGADNADFRGAVGVAGPTEAGANEHRALRCLQGGDEKDGRSDQPRGKASDGLLTPRR